MTIDEVRPLPFRPLGRHPRELPHVLAFAAIAGTAVVLYDNERKIRTLHGAPSTRYSVEIGPVPCRFQPCQEPDVRHMDTLWFGNHKASAVRVFRRRAEHLRLSVAQIADWLEEAGE